MSGYNHPEWVGMLRFRQTILLVENSYMQKMRMDAYMGIRYYDLDYILK